MTLQIDLSRKPYFDDFDDEKNFYRVLYRPSTAVQTRELNQTQSIFQDQLDKFGRSIYKDGSVVEGCSFTFDNNYFYVKIQDRFTNGSVIQSISDLSGSYVRSGNSSSYLEAIIVNTAPGLEALTPNYNTLYVKYLNSYTYSNGAVKTEYSNGDVLELFSSANVAIANVTVANTTNSTGRGYAMTTSEGVIFKNGFFVRVAPQTLVVSKYNNIPTDISVGFDLEEDIITAETDPTLVDNAAGSPNEDAPGAHRLKLVPNLTTRLSSDISNTATFFSLVDFKNGLPVTIRTDPQYSALGKELARRTYETNGDYVINPFILTVENKSTTDANNASYLNLVSSPGVGYVKGNRVEFLNKNVTDIRKGLDTSTIAAQQITANFGYYVYVDEYCGDFNSDQISQVELHSIAKTSITNRTFLSTGYSTSSRIGTAYVRGFAYDDGTPGTPRGKYRLYLFNINMNSGFNFSDVRSVIRYNSGVKAIADLVLEYNGTLQTNIATIQDNANEIMLYPFGQKAIKADGFANVQYVYRNSSNQQFSTTGGMTISVTAAGTGSENFYYQGTLSSVAEESFVIVPTQTRVSSANLNGTVTISTTTANVVGSGTAFDTNFIVGEYINANSETRRISSIVNSTLMIVDSAFSASASGKAYYKEFPAGVPINFGTNGRTITISGNTATLNLNHNINATMQCTVYYDVKRSETKPIGKTIQRDTHIAIYTGNNAGGTTGPWCLGIPDVYRLKHVYVGTTKANTNPDMLIDFNLDNGQRDSYYGLSYISARKPLANNQWLLVVVDNFTQDITQGKGFFTANSYPIDDSNTANTQAITTAQIPVYSSIVTGKTYDLRDSLDFRPYATNTAVANATSNTAATVNPSTVAATPFAVDPVNGSYIPSPDLPYQSTIQYYLPRKDRVSLTIGGDILVYEGISAQRPIAPLEVPDTMTIGIIDVPAYPTLTPADAASAGRYDYAVQSSIQQIKRYTMSDIGKLANRIDRLEYYTSLSLVEQGASALLVRSATTGLNRFKNGILVDPFKDHTIGNTNNPLYRIAIDSTRGEARPLFSQGFVNLYYDDSVSTNTTKTGDIITLDYTSVVNQSQNFASKSINPAVGNQYHFTGTMTLDPPGAISVDITKAPDVIGDLDLSSNWVNMQRYISAVYGSQWGNWTNTLTPSQQGALASSPFTSQVVATNLQQSHNFGRDLQVQNTQSLVTNGNYVTNVSTLPYIQATPVFFSAKGMKPKTTLYAYFNNIPVTSYCYPLTVYTGTVSTVGGHKKTDDGRFVYTDKNFVNYAYNSLFGVVYPASGSLQADDNGNVYGIFFIPDATFRTGELEFILTDVSNLSNITNSTTLARDTFFATNLFVQTTTNGQIRNPNINTSEQTNQNSLNQNTNTPPSNDPVTATPPPQYITSEQYTGSDGGWSVIYISGENFENVETYTGQQGGYATYSIYPNYNGNQDLNAYQGGAN